MKPASSPGPTKRIPAEVYCPGEALLAEAPLWDAGTLYWTDIKGKSLYTKADAAATPRKYDLGLETGAFALWDESCLVLATERGFQGLDLTTRELTPWANPEAELPDNRFNDGKCDPRGRFVAGTMSRRGARDQAALYLLDHDRSARKVYSPVTCSNGLAWSECGTTLFYIDTATRVVRSFSYDLERGQLSHGRVVVEIPAKSGKPDGMTIDREGNLWIALWGGGAVECWSPLTGKRLARIEVPASCVTSCVFGGSRYETLFITTARGSLSPQELQHQDRAGSIFCASPGVAGRPAVRFGGRQFKNPDACTCLVRAEKCNNNNAA